MKKKLNVLLAVMVITSLLLAACAPKATPTRAPTKAPEATKAPEPTKPPAVEEGLIVVGSKDFSEQYILGYIAVLALQDAGYEVDDQVGLGGTAVNREALLAGETDLYWEYTRTPSPTPRSATTRSKPRMPATAWSGWPWPPSTTPTP